MFNNLYNIKSITTYLIIINLIIFIIEIPLGGSTSNNIINKAFTMYTPEVLDGQIWRLFTAIFLHFGFAHIFMNMLALYNIGYFLEEYIGSKKYLLIYIFGGICGNLLVLVSDVVLNNFAIGAGASGAIFAVLGVILYISKFEHNSGLDYRSILITTAIALAPGFFIPGISLAAHIGGLIGGILVYIVLTRIR